MATKQLTLPVTGMTCANCAKNITRNAKKVEGVSEVEVNYASEKFSFNYDTAVASPQAVIERVEKAGYGVVTVQLELRPAHVRNQSPL